MPAANGKTVRDEVDLRQYYDEYYRKGDFAHYPESTDLAYFHAIFSYFSIPVNAHLLDAGCGTGLRLRRMEKLGRRVTGIDLSGEGLHACREATPEAKLVQGDMLALPFMDASFEGVIALGCSLMNADNIAITESMVSEALRVTCLGGWVVATTITDYSGTMRNGWKQRSRKELQQLSVGVPARTRKVLFTAPGIAARLPRLTLHPATSLVMRHIPRYARTVILGWQK